MIINNKITDLQYQLYLDNGYLFPDSYDFEHENYQADADELIFRRVNNDLIMFQSDLERL